MSSRLNETYLTKCPVSTVPGEPAAAATAVPRADEVEPERIYLPPAEMNPDRLYGPVGKKTTSAAVVVKAVPPVPKAVVTVPVRGEAAWRVPLRRKWRWIVIHHSGTDRGNATIFGRAHKRRGWLGLGYDFVIGNGTDSGDGEVETGFRWTRQLQGAHTGDYQTNQHGIGICLVGDFNHSKPSARQMASLRRLVRFLMARTGIPPNRVIGHHDINPKHTVCPGKNFNMAAFRRSLGGSGALTDEFRRTYTGRSRTASSRPAGSAGRSHLILVRHDGAGVP